MSKREIWIDDRCALRLGGRGGPRLVVRNRSVLPMGEDSHAAAPRPVNPWRERIAGGEDRDRSASDPGEPR